MSDLSFADGRLSMGRVISQTFGVIGRNIGAVVIVAFVVAVLTIGLSFAAGYGIGAAFPGSPIVKGAPAVGTIISVVFHSLATGAITYIAVNDLNGERATAGRAFSTGLRLLLPLLGLGIVVGLGIGLGLVLLVVPGLMLLTRWAVASPALVVEGATIGTSMARSKELTAGNRWRIFGLWVVLILFTLLVGVLIGLVSRAFNAGLVGPMRLIVSGALEVVGNTVGTSISATGIAVLYTELRRLREGVLPNQLASVFA